MIFEKMVELWLKKNNRTKTSLNHSTAFKGIIV